MWKDNPQWYLEPFDSVRGYKPRIKKKNGGTPLQFLKVQVSWLLGAAGKAGIKNRERGNFSKFKLLSTI